jgi:hypothetical protein
VLSSSGISFCRVFLYSQSAEAHRLVFGKIDRIVEMDTGQRLLWRHIHSDTLDGPIGVFAFSADHHLGQGQGGFPLSHYFI